MFLTPGHFARTQKWTITRAILPEGDYSIFEGTMRLRTFSFYRFYCFKMNARNIVKQMSLSFLQFTLSEDLSH
jgi:hypothetical protein